MLKKIKKFKGSKNITANIYRIQASDSAMCEYFCNGFIDLMLNNKTNFINLH